MNSKVVFGQYVNVDSWIHRLDPRTKILSLILMMVGVFFINNIIGLLACMAFIFLVVLTSNIPLKLFIKSFRTIAFLMLFTAVFQILFNKTGEVININGVDLASDFTLTWINLAIGVGIFVVYLVLGKFIKKFRLIQLILVIAAVMVLQVYCIVGPQIVTYNVTLYTEGVNTAVIVFLRLVDLLALSALLTFTTKATDLTSGIEGLFAPFKFMKRGVSIIAMMISIAIRFIPTLLNESQKILKAQASRGVDFNEGGLKDKVMQIISLLIPMFIISYKKAEDLANAMEARAYIPGEDRTKIYELKYKVADICVYIFTLLFLGSIIALKVMGIL